MARINNKGLTAQVVRKTTTHMVGKPSLTLCGCELRHVDITMEGEREREIQKDRSRQREIERGVLWLQLYPG